VLDHRTDFDCAAGAGGRNRRGDLDRFVEIVRLDEEERIYLLDLARAVVNLHADETPTTRTIRAAIRAALHGGADVGANLEANALRILAQAIRGLELTGGLSPALAELAANLNQHFDELKSVFLAQASPRKTEPKRFTSARMERKEGAA
jgi:hypothetical protein